MNSHILTGYDNDLRALRDNLIEMGNLALAATEKAMKGLLTGDRDLCMDVIEDDEAIDRREKLTDELGMAILLRFKPVATDLRNVLSSLSICRHLERMGDHAVTIAKRGRKISKLGTLDEVRLIEPLFLEVRRIVSLSLVTFSDLDQSAAHQVIEMDRKIDALHRSLGKLITGKISGGPRETEALLNLLFISRSLERIADLAVNVAEDVVFAASAEDVRHS